MRKVTVAVLLVLLCLSPIFAQTYEQPEIGTRSKEIITVDGLKFKDSNSNGILDPYEDWRLDASERAYDLISKMTLEEKAGMMLIDTLNSDWGGALSDTAYDYINNQNMRRFIFRNTVIRNPIYNPNASARSGQQITPYEAAVFTNAVQEESEDSRLGIPALFKSNARNHFEEDARFGINESAGAFSTWPKEGGLAATMDMDLIKQFATIMNDEWTSIGLRGMYGYMCDLATEPRWYRIHETFSESSDLNAAIATVLVQNLQGSEITKDSVVLTMKHFPGGGPQLNGIDPHYPYGREEVYTGGAFYDHVKPFKAAIDAGLTSVMPYYGIPVGMQDVYKPADDIVYDEEIGVGMAFSKGILEDLLRGELGFVGNVNSDTGIIGQRGWGLEDYTEAQQIAIAVNAGTDVLSGYHTLATVLQVIDKDVVTAETNDYTPKGVSMERVDLAVYRLLLEMFQMGLFENPYVDPDVADATVGKPEYLAAGLEAQKKSVVMLENNGVLPVAEGTKVYLVNVNEGVAADNGLIEVATPEEADVALIRMNIVNVTQTVYNEDGTPYTYPNGDTVVTSFGGAIPSELDLLALSDMVGTKSWKMTPSLEEVNAVAQVVGYENTVLAINFRQPYVLDEESHVRDMGGLFAMFGVSDEALMAVITGEAAPQGRLPYALANSAEAILRQDSDLPGYAEEDTLYPFGYGLTY